MTHVPSGAGAVMASRHEPHDSLDDFPTPPWSTRALVEHVLQHRISPWLSSAWDPACNRGYMVRPLREYFLRVWATDIFDYGDHVGGDIQEEVFDFLPVGQLDPASLHAIICKPDFIISNPPFRIAEQFIRQALMLARHGVAMLVRTSFLEGETRYRELFKPNPPTVIAQFSERVPMLEGRCAKYVIDPKTLKRKRASTATAYAWLVWIKGRSPEPFQWIPPCRAKLERDTDYLEPPRLPRGADDTGVPPGSPSPQDTAGQAKRVSEARNPPSPFTLEDTK